MLVLLGLVVLGTAYGYFSADQNVNPVRVPDPTDPEYRTKAAAAKEWSPSPLWLPSYLVAMVPPSRTVSNGDKEMHIQGYGLENRALGNAEPTGWGFQGTSMNKTRYYTASIGVGAGLGLVIAVILMVSLGWITLRKPPKPEPKPKKEFKTWP
jgi:hypothetical protein